MQSNINMQAGKQKIPAASIAAKMSSKKELFNFLSVEVGVYLCSHDCLTIYFLKQLVSGQKKCKLRCPLLVLTRCFSHKVLPGVLLVRTSI